MTTMIYDRTGVHIDSRCTDGVTIDDDMEKFISFHKDGKPYHLIYVGAIANIKVIRKCFIEAVNLDDMHDTNLSTLLVKGAFVFLFSPTFNTLTEFTVADGMLHAFECPMPYFYGSGRDIARGAYHICKDAEESIKIAAVYDKYTNSNIYYLEG